MKVQGTLIQGALALVGLGAAYATWQREPERAPGEVVVLEATKSDISKVRYEDEKGWVELWRTTEAGEPGVWMKVSAREPTAPGGSKTPERELRGNEAAVRLLDSLAPLRASRALGVVDAAKLKEFGLAPGAAPDGGAPPPFKKRTLSVTARGDVRTFTAGTPTGLYATYLRDERDGRVYLLGGNQVSSLESAGTTMVDRALHTFKAPDYDALTIEAGGKSRELKALPGESPTTTRLAPAKTPDKPDETAKNWHDKLFRTYPTDVLGKGERPAGGEPRMAVKVSYTSKGASKGFIEIGKLAGTPPPPRPPPAPGAKAPPPPPPPPTEYWARTEHTASWVKLGYGAEDIAKEAEKIAAAE